MKTEINERQRVADSLLKNLSEILARTQEVEAEVHAEMEAVQKKYKSEILFLKEKHQEKEKILLNLMKAERAEIFDGRDKVSLDHGVLLYGKEGKVSIPRDALEKIKGAGWLDAIKVAESVDRGVVEKWPDEKLTVIGAVRKPKEKYEYELK